MRNIYLFASGRSIVGFKQISFAYISNQLNSVSFCLTSIFAGIEVSIVYRFGKKKLPSMQNSSVGLIFAG